MAGSPLFIASDFATPVAVIDNIDTDVTGGGTYDTIIAPGARAIVTGVLFVAVTNTIDTLLYLYVYNGTNNRRLGKPIPIRQSVAKVIGDEPWSALWTPPSYPFILESTWELRAAMLSGSATLHAWALGGLL